MDATPEQIKAAIAALEPQRGALGNAVLDAALAPLHCARCQVALRRTQGAALAG